MVDMFLENGFNYFDTAHGYLEGKSETAIRDCLSRRHKREEFILTNKLTMEYFDFYLMHAQSADIFQYFKKYNAYETALELKKEGKIRHFGISFHDRAEVLEEILKEYPQIE